MNAAWQVVAQLGPSDGLTGENDSLRIQNDNLKRENKLVAAERNRYKDALVPARRA